MLYETHLSIFCSGPRPVVVYDQVDKRRRHGLVDALKKTEELLVAVSRTGRSGSLHPPKLCERDSGTEH
jgi:hypothetical protein